jgi:hypothetical protein
MKDPPGLASAPSSHRRHILLGLMAGSPLLAGALRAAPAHAEPLAGNADQPNSVFRPDDTGSRPIDRDLETQLSRSYREFNRTITIPNGRYRKVGTTVVRQGVLIAGEGSQGSSYDSGTAFVQSGGSGAFEWNGSGAPFQGTGGGLKNALIVKDAGSHGGTAIRLQATDDEHRPGEMILENVLVYAKPRADWAHGLVIDGTASDTPQMRGVRSVYLIKCRFVDSTVDNETVLLNQVTHLYAFGLAVDPGHVTNPSGMTLRGINDGVYFVNSGIGGNVIITAADEHNQTRNFHFHGKISGYFRNDDPAVNGSLIASFDSQGKFVLLNRSPELQCVTNINPDFALALSDTTEGVTGDGVVATVVFDRVVRDQGNHFAPGRNDRYVAYCAGTHRLSARVSLSGFTRDHNRGELRLRQSGSRNRVVPYAFAAPGHLPDAPLTYTLDASFELAYGDAMSVEVMVAGGAHSVKIIGETDVEYTGFEGRYAS